MKEIKRIEEKVIDILQAYPDSRSNDFVLYARYIQLCNPELAEVGLVYALMEAKRLKMPNYESVTRCRRKIQETHPELRAPRNISGKRAAREELFREYSKS